MISDRCERGTNSIQRDNGNSLTTSRKTVLNNFQDSRTERESAMTRKHLDSFNLRTVFDAVVPIHHAIGARIYESFGNARRNRTQLAIV